MYVFIFFLLCFGPLILFYYVVNFSFVIIISIYYHYSVGANDLFLNYTGKLVRLLFIFDNISFEIFVFVVVNCERTYGENREHFEFYVIIL